MTTAVAPSTGAKSFLSSLAGKASPKKGRDDKPVISASDLQPDATRILDLRSQIEGLEGQLSPLEDQFSKAAAVRRLEWCRANGKLVSSIKICGLTFSQKCQYSKVPVAHEETLREKFGEKFGLYFKPKMEVALTEEAAADDAFLETFVNAMVAQFGEDEFARRFKVSRTIAVSEQFHADVTLDSKVEKLAEEFVDSEVIKAYKPTLKE